MSLSRGKKKKSYFYTVLPFISLVISHSVTACLSVCQSVCLSSCLSSYLFLPPFLSLGLPRSFLSLPHLHARPICCAPHPSILFCKSRITILRTSGLYVCLSSIKLSLYLSPSLILCPSPPLPLSISLGSSLYPHLFSPILLTSSLHYLPTLPLIFLTISGNSLHSRKIKTFTKWVG